MSITPFDLSKPPHSKTIDLVAPLLPGLFFEISVFWGRPELGKPFMDNGIYHLGYYTRLSLVVFCAYFIGLVFVMTTTLFLNLTEWSYRKISRWSTALPLRIAKFMGRKTQPQGWVITKIVYPITRHLITRDIDTNHQAELAYNVWIDAAKQVLQKHYGIDPPEGVRAEEKWAIWYSLLGTPTNEQVRGSSFIRAMYAAGCLGLVAVQIAPTTLRNRYYCGLSLLLIFIGLNNDIKLSRSWANPLHCALNRTLTVMSDLPKETNESPEANESKAT